MASQEQVEFYNNFVSHFEKQKDNHRNTSYREWIGKWVKGGKVLDFGSALGYNSAEIKGEIVGIDISPDCIEIAKSRYPDSTWYCGDITDGFDPGERDFDFILMSDVIEHVPLNRHEILFEKLSEWSKPKAVILVSVPDYLKHEESIKKTFQLIDERVYIPELLHVMANHNFRRITSMFLDYIYYRMVVQKDGNMIKN